MASRDPDAGADPAGGAGDDWSIPVEWLGPQRAAALGVAPGREDRDADVDEDGFRPEPLAGGEARGLERIADRVQGWAGALPVRTWVVVGVVVAGLAGTGLWWMGRDGGPVAPELAAATTPLGSGTLQLPGSCEEVPAAEEDAVSVGAVECPLAGGAALTVVEMDFRQAQADRLEPRFLADTLLASRSADWPGTAIDAIEDVPAPAGAGDGAVAATFTGRVTVGDPARTAGRLVVVDNRALLVAGRAPERSAVEGVVDTVAGSLVVPVDGSAAPAG